MDWKLIAYILLVLITVNGYFTTKREDDDNVFVIAIVKGIYLAGAVFSLYYFINYLIGMV
jgi:hypothetical protein